MTIYITPEPHNRHFPLNLTSLKPRSTLMLAEKHDIQGHGHALSASGLVARLTGINIEGEFREPGRSDRFVVVSIDDREEWKSKKCSSGSRLHWQEDHRLHPSSSIKFEIFRSGILSKISPDKRYLLGQFFGKAVELLENSVALDLQDLTGARLASVKIKIQWTGSMRRFIVLTTAYSSISEDIDASATMAEAAYSSTETASSCIPSLGQALEAVVKIARTFISCTVLFSVYEDLSKAWKDELLQDKSVRELAESLREIVCAAHECPDLSVIKGTEDVIEAIGQISLEIASFIDKYARRIFVGELCSSSCARCQNLTEKFGSRISNDTNRMVRQLKDGNLAERHKEILQWLNAPDPSQNYNTAREKHREGTGSWFLSGSEFSSWKNQSGRMQKDHFMVSTSAIKDIMDHCATDRSTAVGYFFFDSRDAQEGLQCHESLVRSLIEQFTL
ncbi:hypothetical protein HETIRDRAFT_425330 [Heterobasidion irregulare TC 32-1]|uniref:C2 domain-containing protein n=1 Tax=Heterobasidion irregulare (strain TC 32-1) TaxID=747525 RepID=W4KCR8_HETIT|nr:uncharacterized protein HETIRDRAFT_425330 [Heterobasidion irregulare TC 32-1]ETW83657.1 hypothetical protein HETIRDRAFT_425330 [Heterobasidion irregulare TC 32-1]